LGVLLSTPCYILTTNIDRVPIFCCNPSTFLKYCCSDGSYGFGGPVSAGCVFQSSILPLGSKVFSLSVVILHQQVLFHPTSTPSSFSWNEFFAPGRPQRLLRHQSLTASRVIADGSTTFTVSGFIESPVRSVQEMKSVRWCLLFDRTAKLWTRDLE
jgi:hypothetical protein